MTLVSSIIQQAYRESNIKARVAPITSDESAEALVLLQNIVMSTMGDEVGYKLEDWDVQSASNITEPTGVTLTAPQAAAWIVAPSARLICNLAAPLTLVLDPKPMDGQTFAVIDAAGGFATNNLTLNGNGRLPISNVLNTNGFSGQWMYRADTATWTAITNFLTTDQFPFPQDFDDYFIISLALRIDPRNGKQLGQSSAARMEQQRLQLVDRYRQSRTASETPAPSTDSAGASQ